MLNVIVMRSYKIWVSILCIACIIAFAPVQVSAFDKDRWEGIREGDKEKILEEDFLKEGIRICNELKFWDFGIIEAALVGAIVCIFLGDVYEEWYNPEIHLTVNPPFEVEEGEPVTATVMLDNDHGYGVMTLRMESDEGEVGYFKCFEDLTVSDYPNVKLVTEGLVWPACGETITHQPTHDTVIGTLTLSITDDFNLQEPIKIRFKPKLREGVQEAHIYMVASYHPYINWDEVIFFFLPTLIKLYQHTMSSKELGITVLPSS